MRLWLQLGLAVALTGCRSGSVPQNLINANDNAPVVPGNVNDNAPVPDNANANQPDGPSPALALELVHSGLDRPVDLQTPPDGTGRLFIVEQPGRVRISDGGVLQASTDAFLDLTALVESSGAEQGLLGLAFHPDFAANGRFYVNYTRRGDAVGDTIIAEYRVSNDPNRADPASAVEILHIVQPFANHNGGQLQFGPDRMLYAGTGDGGSGCDPGDRAQNPQERLGKLLRLDVDRPPAYVPADNPLVNDPAANPLVWAVGLRNPWRFGFDALTGLLYIADVGQNQREEIDIVSVAPTVALNFGWRTFEGTLTAGETCDRSAFDASAALPPRLDYSHDEGCSITGGYVYRGQALPALAGLYFYSDYCSAFLRVLRFEGGAVVSTADITAEVEQRGGTLNHPTSFGMDAAGELYVLDHDGDVFRLIATP